MTTAALALLVSLHAGLGLLQGAPPAPVDPNAKSLDGAPPKDGHAPIAPPFVPRVGASPQRPNAHDGELPPPYIPGARQFLVQTGQSWGHIIRDAKPGDEIIFPAGFHLPQVIDGLQGTRDKPIFLRSRDRVPAAVACEGNGWVFRRCRHLVVENILFLNPRDAAVVVDGAPVPGAPADSELGMPLAQPWPAEITIRQCTVAGTRPNPDQDAFRLHDVQDVRLDSLRVDGWNDAAVEVDGSRRVLVRALMMVPTDKYAQRCGIRVLGASGEISVTGCSFNKTMGVGVSVGSPAPAGADGTRPMVAPVERMRIDRCIYENIGTPVEIVNARDLVLSRLTIVNPVDAMYAIPQDAGIVEQVLIEKVAAFWFPGAMKRFSPHPDRIPPTAVTLADNLWYSVELPTAWEELGAPFGYQTVPQVFGIDPSIDSRTLRAKNPDAIRFGAHSIASPGGQRPGPDDMNAPDPAEPARASPAPATAKPPATPSPTPSAAPSGPSPGAPPLPTPEAAPAAPPGAP